MHILRLRDVAIFAVFSTWDELILSCVFIQYVIYPTGMWSKPGGYVWTRFRESANFCKFS